MHVTVPVFRNYMIHGNVYCGRSPKDPEKIVVVAIAGHPSHPEAVSAHEHVGDWRDDILAEYLEAEAMLFAAKHGLYPMSDLISGSKSAETIRNGRAAA